YDPSELTLESKVGVATGLAYTSVGGEVLEIEVSVVGGRGKLQLTGTLGEVMKESASAALSYARSRAAALGIDREFHRNRDLHVHIPAGATPARSGPLETRWSSVVSSSSVGWQARRGGGRRRSGRKWHSRGGRTWVNHRS